MTLTYQTVFANGEGTETFIYDTCELAALAGPGVGSTVTRRPPLRACRLEARTCPRRARCGEPYRRTCLREQPCSSTAWSAGTGRLTWKPCAWVQPSALSTASCSAVSTPSAVVSMPSLCDSWIVAWTIASESLVPDDAFDEAAVDLDLVERERAQVAEARIAGAEIVHRDAHAERGELLEQRAHPGLVVQQHRFGDLELEPLGRRGPAVRQRARSSPRSGRRA